MSDQEESQSSDRNLTGLALAFFLVGAAVGAGIALLVARLLHGYALSFTQKFRFGRFYGAGLTFLVLLACGVLCVWQGVHGFALT